MILKTNTIVTPLPTDELIQKYEGFWRLELNRTFSDFIKEYNGVEVEDAEFVCNSRTYMIERFLCIVDIIKYNSKATYDINVLLSQIGERLIDNGDLLGADVLPIAVLFAGDFVCLDFRVNKENPTVSVWSHEESGDFEPTYYKIADSFTEFLEILHRGIE